MAVLKKRADEHLRKQRTATELVAGAWSMASTRTADPVEHCEERCR
jgi:hypothetical protein